MRPFTQLAGTACPLPWPGIDTDQLIPARFMKRTRAEGYGDVLLHDQRFDAGGAPRPEHPMNAPERRGASILVARRNFGSGSSREAAVYALVDHGIRCVVAPSFGDIFAANAVNNGLLPAQASEAAVEELLGLLEGGLTDVAVDLQECRVAAGGRVFPFSVDPVWRTKLLHGWDDIDLTLSHLPEIDAYAARDRAARPWAAHPWAAPRRA